MDPIKDLHVTCVPTSGDDYLKIFLSNLDGRINTQDLNAFFNPFGTIEHIESWTPKSAVILFSDIHSVDRVLAKHRKCIINNQEIYIRRFRYGYIERAYMDSTVLFIRPKVHDSSVEWTDTELRRCFHKYDENIDKIRVVAKPFHALIYFTDYDIVDRILLQTWKFRIDNVALEMKRAKSIIKQAKHADTLVGQLLQKNKKLKHAIERQKVDARHEVKLLKCKISRLNDEIVELKSRYHHSKSCYKY